MRNCLILLLFLSVYAKVRSQEIPNFGYLNNIQFNPAGAGISEYPVINLLSNSFMGNYVYNKNRGLPNLYIFSADGNINKINSGVGIVFRYYEYSNEKQYSPALVYNYKIKFSEISYLRLGMQFTYTQSIISGNSANSLQQINNKFYVNIGLWYKLEKLNVGLSMISDTVHNLATNYFNVFYTFEERNLNIIPGIIYESPINNGVPSVSCYVSFVYKNFFMAGVS